MCGIHCIFGKRLDLQENLERSSRIKHRGGDDTGYYKNDTNTVILIHERLSITGINNGHQPIYSKNKDIVLVANGEIYNYKELYEKYFPDIIPETQSDCEIIIHMYENFGFDFMTRNKLLGMFAFVLYNIKTNEVIIARDHIGMIPLYYGWDNKYNLYITSEFKTISDNCLAIYQFSPGTYSGKNILFIPYYKPNWKSFKDYYPSGTFDKADFRDLMTEVVQSHMNTEAPYGVLLSGGLDSSLIASIANKLHDTEKLGKLKSFCIGFEDSPDIKAAEEIAKFLNTEHYSFVYDLKTGLGNIEKTIYHLETYDTTTIRAATPMVLMAEEIHKLGIKMVLTGEGADELWGSYAYFQYAPNAKKFYKETVRKMLDLKNYDLLRCNKAMMSYSIEARVPYLDQRVIDYIMSLDPKYKIWNNMTIEKFYMRSAFIGYLPDKFLWRKKEQFSDGVGYSWVDNIQKYSKEIITNMPEYKFNDSVIQPETYEEKYYRFLFEKYYSSNACLKTFKFTKSIACSTGKALKWLKNIKTKDPSGRAINENNFFIE